MSTWARTSTGDMLLPSIGQGATAIVTDPATCAAIKIEDEFGLNLGEWYQDTRQGFPWNVVRGVRNPKIVAARQMFRQVVLKTPQIASCDEVSFVYDTVNRNLKWSFAAVTNDGATVTGGSDQPFIVTPVTS